MNIIWWLTKNGIERCGIEDTGWYYESCNGVTYTVHKLNFNLTIDTLNNFFKDIVKFEKINMTLEDLQNFEDLC